MDKKQSRLRRSLQTRHKIAELRVDRLTVFRSNLHIYANIVAATGDKVLVSASTLETEVRAQLAGQTGRGGNTAAVGRLRSSRLPLSRSGQNPCRRGT